MDGELIFQIKSIFQNLTSSETKVTNNENNEIIP